MHHHAQPTCRRSCNPPAPGPWRARPQMMLCIGMLYAPLMDWALAAAAGPHAWRWMVGLPALPGAAMAASLWILPESPRWLVMWVVPSARVWGLGVYVHRVARPHAGRRVRMHRELAAGGGGGRAR